MEVKAQLIEKRYKKTLENDEEKLQNGKILPKNNLKRIDLKKPIMKKNSSFFGMENEQVTPRIDTRHLFILDQNKTSAHKIQTSITKKKFHYPMKKKVDITSSKEKLMINRKKKLYQQIHNRKMKIKYGKYDNILDKNEKVDIIDLNKKTNTKRKKSNNINMDYSSKKKLFWKKFFYLEGHNSTKNKLDEKKILFSPSVIQSSKPIFTDIRDKPTIKHMNSFQSLHTECPNNYQKKQSR